MKEALEQPAAPSRPDLQRVLRVFLGRRWRHLALVSGLALLLSLFRSGDGADAGSHEASLAAVLADRDITVQAASVVWLE